MVQIKAVIYDVDGLLLDTEKHYDTAMATIAGRPVPSELRIQMFGRKPIESARLFVAGMKLDLTPEQYLEERQPILAKLFSQSELLPGAEQLIHHLHAHQIPQAAATSSTTETFKIKTAQHRSLFDLLTCAVTSDQVEHGKPHPEPFLKAAACLKIEPQHCLAFEDAPSGIQAAKAATMSVIAVPHPLLDQKDIAQADQTLSSLEEFNPVEWGLPPHTSN